MWCVRGGTLALGWVFGSLGFYPFFLKSLVSCYTLCNGFYTLMN